VKTLVVIHWLYRDSELMEMHLVDPIVVAGKSKMTPLTEEEAYDLSQPPQRLLYLMRAYEVRNRVLIPIARGNIVYGGVCFTNSQPFTRGNSNS
jgi:hypothetical protein